MVQDLQETCTGTTTPSNTQTFTNKSGNISQWTNDSGYTTCTGDITNVKCWNWFRWWRSKW